MKFELSHDAIAQQVAEKASETSKQRRRIKTMLQNKTTYYNQSQGDLLTQKELKRIKPFLPSIDKSIEVDQFIEKSRQVLYKKYLLSTILFLFILSFLVKKQYQVNREQQRANRQEQKAIGQAYFNQGQWQATYNPSKGIQSMYKGWQQTQDSSNLDQIYALYQKEIFYDRQLNLAPYSIHQAVFAPDGHTVAVLVADQAKVLLYHWDSEQAIDSLEGAGNDLTSIRFSEEGQYILAGGTDRRTHLWHLASKEWRTFPKETPPLRAKSIDALDLSYNNKFIAVAQQSELTIWSTKNSQQAIHQKDFEMPIQQVLFLNDSPTQLLIGTKTGQVFLYSTTQRSTEFIYQFEQPITFLQRAATVPVILMGSNKKFLTWLWADNTLKQLPTTDSLAQENFTSLNLSSNGQYVFGGCSNHQIKLYNRGKNTVRTLKGHCNNPIAVQVNQQLTYAFSAAKDTTLIRWRFPVLHPSYQIDTLSSAVKAMTFGKDESSIWVGTGTGKVYHYFKDFQQSSHQSIHRNPITAIAVNEQKGIGASGDKNGLVVKWTIQAEKIAQIDTIWKGSQEIKKILLSKDGNTALIAQKKDTVPVAIPFNSSVPIRPFLSSKSIGRINSISWSMDNQQLISTHQDSTLIIWDVPNRQVKNRYHHPTKHILQAHFLPGTNAIISSANKPFLYFWNQDTEELVAKPSSSINNRYFEVSDNGQFLATAALTSSIIIRESSGSVLGQLPPQPKIWSLAITYNGQVVAAGTSNGFNVWRNDRIVRGDNLFKLQD